MLEPFTVLSMSDIVRVKRFQRVDADADLLITNEEVFQMKNILRIHSYEMVHKMHKYCWLLIIVQCNSVKYNLRTSAGGISMFKESKLIEDESFSLNILPQCCFQGIFLYLWKVPS